LNQVGYAAGLLLKSLRDPAEQWWYFLNDPSVPPDNNLAERSLRPSVTKRKVSGGSRSMKRFEETANLLSVIQTCRFQTRSVIDFFREAISAHSCDYFPIARRVRTPVFPRAVSFSNFSCAKILNENINIRLERASIQLSIKLRVE
jgi:transposase